MLQTLPAIYLDKSTFVRVFAVFSSSKNCVFFAIQSMIYWNITLMLLILKSIIWNDAEVVFMEWLLHAYCECKRKMQIFNIYVTSELMMLIV